MPHCSDFSNDHMNSHFPVLVCSDYRWSSKEIGNVGNWKRTHPYRGLMLINIHSSPDATKWREDSVREPTMIYEWLESCSWLINQRWYKGVLAVENLCPSAPQSIYLIIKALHVWATEKLKLRKSWKDSSIRRRSVSLFSAGEHRVDVEIAHESSAEWTPFLFFPWQLWCWQHFHQVQIWVQASKCDISLVVSLWVPSCLHECLSSQIKWLSK